MRFAVRVLALPVAAFLGAASPSPDASLAAVAAACGHASLVHVRAVAAGMVEGRRFELTFEQLGQSRLVRRCVAEVCGGSWFDGLRRWTFGLNEVPLPDDGDPSLPQRRTLAAIASYAFAEPAFRAAGGTVAGAGPNAWRIRARGGATLVAQLDPGTHLLRRVETEAGETIAGYRGELRAGRASIPAVQTGLDAVALETAQVVTGPLVAPAGPAVAYTGGGALPLANDDPVPIVPCTLGGHSVRCLLDTGATPSAIALPLAERLGLEPHGELEIAAFNQFATGFVEAGPLALGAARFERARFAVVPSTFAARFDVIVGADLLGRVRLILDRNGHTARITAPAEAGPAGSESTAVPLRFPEGVPRVEVTLGDQAPERALFDSGDQAVVSFGYAAYRRGTQWPLVGRTEAVGLGNSAEDAFTVDVPAVRIGTYAAGVTRATVRRTQVDPHVGIGLWGRLVIEIDEAAAELILRAR